MKTLTHYQQLQQQSQQLRNPDAQAQTSLGMILPPLTSAALSLSRTVVHAEALAQAIARFAPTQGWVMYRDSLALYMQAPSTEDMRQDILEAEFCKQEQGQTHSLTIKHLSGSQYQVLHFDVQAETTPASDAETQYCYREQSLLIRSNLLGQASAAEYRLWFVLDDHAWQPLCQQFVGFLAPNPPQGA